MASQYKQDIIEAQQQVREAEMQVARQEAIIDLLEQDNLDTTEPQRLLVTFKQALAAKRKRLQLILDCW
jgi:uncharacterized membrane protein